MFNLVIKRTTGKVETIELDREDIEEILFITACGSCGKYIVFDEHEFRQIAADTDFYSSWYCNKECADKAANTKNADGPKDRHTKNDFEIVKKAPLA